MVAESAVVCDASALAAVIFGEPDSDHVLSLTRARRLFSPTLLRYELGQTALRKCSATPTDSERIETHLADSLRLPVQLLQPSWLAAFRLAKENGLTIHDASYLQLALELKIPLITLDKRLSRVARGLGVA
jgi:predicted nucleic acid-binding protein